MRSMVSCRSREVLEPELILVGATGKKEGKTRLLNIVMQLRKCCNHPYRELLWS